MYIHVYVYVYKPESDIEGVVVNIIEFGLEYTLQSHSIPPDTLHRLVDGCCV